MGLLGPRKKRGNMELVEKKSDQSREALRRGPVLPQHSMHVKELQSAFFTHTSTHTHTYTRARTHTPPATHCLLLDCSALFHQSR